MPPVHACPGLALSSCNVHGSVSAAAPPTTRSMVDATPQSTTKACMYNGHGPPRCLHAPLFMQARTPGVTYVLQPRARTSTAHSSPVCHVPRSVYYPSFRIFKPHIIIQNVGTAANRRLGLYLRMPGWFKTCSYACSTPSPLRSLFAHAWLVQDLLVRVQHPIAIPAGLDGPTHPPTPALPCRL